MISINLSRCRTGLICLSVLTSSLLILKLFPLYKESIVVKQLNGDLFSDLDRLSLTHGGKGILFDLLLNSNQDPKLCRKAQVLMILVTSAPWHLEQRNSIRNTWAKKQGKDFNSWQVLFLIGQHSGVGTSPEILKEQQTFGDILVGNYVDCYRNLTLKVMHGMKWVAENCEPQFVLKTDDDCFVNTYLLPRFLVKFNNIKSGLYAGSLFPQAKRRVIRDPFSKWYVSWEDFEEEWYPPYTSGIGYVLSHDAVLKILKVAEHVRPIPVEDAYMGILAKEAGIPVRSSARFMKHNINWRVCNYRYLMVIHHLNATELKVAQQNMVKAKTACSSTEEITTWK